MNIRVLAQGLRFPEGPVVMSDGRVFCVELLGGSIAQYDRETKALTRIVVGGAPNGLLAKDDFTLWFCDSAHHAIRSLNLRTGDTQVIANRVDGEPLRAPNDLILDRKGTLLFTCPGGSQKEPIGYVCAMKADGIVHKVAEGMKFPNGLLLINDDKQILINETWHHRLLIGDWNHEAMKIENIRPFYTIGGLAEPDGLALSKEGIIHAAVYATGHVWVFDHEAKLIQKIPLPGNNPTNLCFDEVGDLGLIVTEAEKGLLLSLS